MAKLRERLGEEHTCKLQEMSFTCSSYIFITFFTQLLVPTMREALTPVWVPQCGIPIPPDARKLWNKLARQATRHPAASCQTRGLAGYKINQTLLTDGAALGVHT